jgi:hypothetical protein
MATLALAFSSGGGTGVDEHGFPFLQSCDALYVCGSGVCPAGMTAVAPPNRSSTYMLGTQSGTTSYVPNTLLPLLINVTQPTIVGKRNAGQKTVGQESAKYLGLLLYAVDKNERKVGGWAIPLQTPMRFWLPPDPGCEGRSLMHASAEYKNFRERFVFRTPPEGTGPITFRALVKQGETNRGAFYWMGDGINEFGGEVPAFGVAGGDIVLTEASPPAPPPPAETTWLRASVGESCQQACADAGGSCVEAELSSATATSPSLLDSLVDTYLCSPPLLATCDEAAPRMSGIGDGCGSSRPCPAAAD